MEDKEEKVLYKGEEMTPQEFVERREIETKKKERNAESIARQKLEKKKEEEERRKVFVSAVIPQEEDKKSDYYGPGSDQEQAQTDMSMYQVNLPFDVQSGPDLRLNPTSYSQPAQARLGGLMDLIDDSKIESFKKGGKKERKEDPIKKLDEAVITPVSKYQQEYKDKNSYQKFYDQKVDEYLRNMPKGLGKMMGISSDRVPDNLIKKINDEYQYNMNNYVADEVVKNKKYDVDSREEWVDELKPSEYEVFANSKYTGKLKPNLWTRTRAGVRALGNTLLPGQPISYDIKGLTPKEQGQYKENKLAAFDALAFSDLPGAMISNYLVDSRDYAKRPDLLSGELNANLAEGAESLLNPLTYAEGIGVTDLISKTPKALKYIAKETPLKNIPNLFKKDIKYVNLQDQIDDIVKNSSFKTEDEAFDYLKDLAKKENKDVFDLLETYSKRGFGFSGSNPWAAAEVIKSDLHPYVSPYLYHGTSDTRLKSILELGLDNSKGKAVNTGGMMADVLGGGKTTAAGDMRYAKSFSEISANATEGKPVILRFKNKNKENLGFVGMQPSVKGKNIEYSFDNGLTWSKDRSILENTDFKKGGIKTTKSKDGTITNKFKDKEGNTVVQVKTADGKYYEKVIDKSQHSDTLGKLKSAVKNPIINNEISLEDRVNFNIKNPQSKASRMSRHHAEKGEDPIDNIRHPFAGRYTAEALYKIRKEDTPWAPDWMNKGAAWLDANMLGIGHEAGTVFRDERPWNIKLREAAEDIYNNGVGINVGLSDKSPRQKTDYLLDKAYNYELPDGRGEERPFRNSWTDPYEKKRDGGIFSKLMDDNNISTYKKSKKK